MTEDEKLEIKRSLDKFEELIKSGKNIPFINDDIDVGPLSKEEEAKVMRERWNTD